MSKADDLKARMGLSGPPLSRIPSTPPAIPDHEMLRCIGQGSYGEVWLARTAVGTFRAVKVVYRDTFKDATPYEREFSGIQKYEPISRANEGLVDVLQIGRNDTEGYFYYVMELADSAAEPLGEDEGSKMEDGKSGAEVSRSVDPQSSILDPQRYVPKTLARELHTRGRLTFDECLQLGLTLNLALGYLHRHGLIHRDVKPSNIIFVNGVPKLADIGLVTDLAEAQSFVGTVGFIPPEGPNSPQADIYALGKVLYEASMGKDRQEFPEPFTRLGLDADSKALMELNAILLKACAAPKERYLSAEEMNADLALLNSGKSVKNKHAVERRLKLATRMSVVAGMVALIALAEYFYQRFETREVCRLSEENRIMAEQNRTTADVNRHQLVQMLHREALGYVGQSADTQPRFISHTPADRLENRIQELAGLLVAQGKTNELEQFYEEIVPPALVNPSQRAMILSARAGSLARRGQWKAAMSDLTEAIELEPTNGWHYHLLAPLPVAVGNPEAYHLLCQRILRQFGGSEDAPDVIKACLILPSPGVDLKVVNQWADSVGESRDLNTRLWVQYQKGLLEYRLGRFGNAIEWMGKVLIKVGYANRPGRDVGAYAVQAMAHYQLKHTNEARAAFGKAIEVEQTKLPKVESGDIGAVWPDWIISHALVKEAKALIEGDPEPRATK